MRRCTSKFVRFAVGIAVWLQSGCAYFRPSESEDEYLQGQEELRQQQEYRKTLPGMLMDAGVRAAEDGLKSLNHQ